MRKLPLNHKGSMGVSCLFSVFNSSDHIINRIICFNNIENDIGVLVLPQYEQLIPKCQESFQKIINIFQKSTIYVPIRKSDYFKYILYPRYDEYQIKNNRGIKMNFKNQRFITKGVSENVDPGLIILLWALVDDMPRPCDYLQVFEISENGPEKRLTHYSEQPEYKREYLLKTDTPVFVGKIYVIDDGDHSTMLLAEEY